MARRSYDAIVVGAGSVGVPTALFLTLEGFKVIVLDSDFRSCGFYFLISGNTKPQSDEVRRVF